MSLEGGSESPNTSPEQDCGSSASDALRASAYDRRDGNHSIIDNSPVRPDSGINATGGYGTEVRTSQSFSPDSSSEPIVVNHPNGLPNLEIIRTPERQTPGSSLTAQGEVRGTQRIPRR